MRHKIMSYFEMCQKERTSLQRGMNFRLHGKHSVILMALQPNAPYQDSFQEDDSILLYEGHDVPRTSETPEPEKVDQPRYLPSGKRTENGKFYKAAQEYKEGLKGPDIVKVYGKLKKGIWADNGYFHLVDSWIESDDIRRVFKFELAAIRDSESSEDAVEAPDRKLERTRVIPSHVKLEVWRRDNDMCTQCGVTEELHFDHIIPFSKGGTSIVADNVQILCARHNLEKSARVS